MGKQDINAVEVSNEIKCVGTIESVSSIKSNGGGWKFSAILNDPDIIAELSHGLKKVCVFTIGISESKSGAEDGGDMSGQMELTEALGHEEA
jgi:hypothetical protein